MKYSRAAALAWMGWGAGASLLAQGPMLPPPHSAYAPQMAQEQGYYDPQIQHAAAGIPAQPVQLTTDPRRPLDSRIEAMPRANMKIEIIHHRSQLVVTRDRIRRIAWSDPNVIDVVQFSENEISILGMSLGSTDLQIWFEGQEQPLMYVATVIKDPTLEEQRRIDYGRIERKLSLLYPNSKVYLIPMSRKIIVRGQARDAEEAAKIMQIIRGEVIVQDIDDFGYGDDYGAGGGGPGVAPPGALGSGWGRGNGLYSSLIVDELQVPGEFQINIRVRIASLDRSQLRRLGMDALAIINDGAVTLASTLAGGPTTLTGIFDNGNVNVAIAALASNGTIKVMEDARLTTLSGEPAAFLAGGEFAVPTIIGIAGAQGQSTSFRGFGTSVITTPTLVDHDLIRLQIVPELSSVNNANAVGGIPGLNVKRVQTRVELREGQTIVLGGLFSRQEAVENTRIPFLGEIPILGTFLFHTKRATEDEKELLIIVTPEIVRAMDPDQVPPLPGWYATHPDDCDFYKYNRTEGNPDMGYYQLLPYGNGQGFGRDAGYNFFNPAPADGRIAPQPTGGAAPTQYPTQVPGIDPNLQGPGMGTYPQQTYPPQPGYPQPDQYAPPAGGPAMVPPAPNYPSPQAQPTPATTQTGQINRSNPAVRQASGTYVDPRQPGYRKR
ncbi:pilus assembly protein N-terminal domain-containing protein [Planctomicrobium sp. SH664]|uniref:type II and III secretion system protein family protein n=1 Tax=Planctomicrobium sp. SH664 TaxID=3448125 RepID=UPI003F5BD6AA